MLSFNNFSVFCDSKPIVQALSAEFISGQVIVISGDNGSGKSTLAGAIMGLSGYTTQGELTYKNQLIADLAPEQRAQLGIFLAYQYPVEVPGLRITTFLQHAYRACHGTALPLSELDSKIANAFATVGLPAEFLARTMHEGFSGGQKKRLELVQMLVLEPQVIIFDELDSGLDAAGITMLTQVIRDYKVTHAEAIFIIITHSAAFATACHADKLLTMQAGRFV